MKWIINVDVQDLTDAMFPAYFRIRKGRSKETKEFSKGYAFADYDSSGGLLGIEFLGPCQASVPDQIGVNK